MSKQLLKSKMMIKPQRISTSLFLLTPLASFLIETKAQALYDFIFPIEIDYIPTSRPVVFDCQLENKWSKDTHPIDFPIHHDPHLGPPLIMSHAKEYNAWSAGLLASPGIKQIAEMGKTGILKQEFHNSELTKDFVQGNRTQKTHQDESDVQIIKDLQVQLDAKHSCISTITKIIPSPDWFTGFQDFQPINYTSNTWFDGFTINTYPMDAGTKSGETYLRNGFTTTETIFQYTEATVPDTFVFLDQFGSSVPPVATWSCLRQDLGRTSQSSSNLRSGSEYRSPIPRNFIDDGKLRSNIPVSTPVKYSVTFSGTWTANNHPNDYPSSAQFTPHILLVHSEGFQLWTPGEVASEAVTKMAQDADGSGIVGIINNDGGEFFKDATIGSGATGASISDQLVGTISLDSTFNTISAIATLVPSPDWFTGFASVKPIDNGKWLRQFSIEALPWDVGTMSGTTYGQAGEKYIQPDVITRITPSFLPKTSPVFVTSTGQGGVIVPLGRYNFELMTEELIIEPATIKPTAAPVFVGVTYTPVTTPPEPLTPIISDNVYPSPEQPNVHDQVIPITPTMFPESSGIISGIQSILPISTPVKYSVTFSGTWTANNHPNDYPSSAQFTPHILLVHSEGFQLWTPGEVASEAVTKMAQDADGSGIVGIINNDGGEFFKDATIGSGATGASIADQLVGTISLDSTFNTISAIATLVPSPDWFTGFASVKPIDNGKWLRQFSIEALPWDVGTMSGTTYGQAGEKYIQPDVITRITPSFLPKTSPVFVTSTGQGGVIVPLGRYNFELMMEELIIEPATMKPTVMPAENPPILPTDPYNPPPVPNQQQPIQPTPTFPNSMPQPSYVVEPSNRPETQPSSTYIQVPTLPLLSPTILQTTAKPTEKASESPSSQPTREPRLIVATASYDITDSFIEDYIPLWQPISYNCQFRNKWTANRHPKDYPINASWSKPFLISHSLNYDLWKIGDLASSSIQQLLKYSDASALEEGLTNALSMPLSSVGDFRVGSHQTLYDTSSQSIENIKINKKHPFLTTLVGMSPSPDWFSGLLKFSPTSNETWLDEFTLETYPWDAGIDSGITYTSPSAPSDPLQVIYRLSNTTVPNSMVLLDPMEENVISVASWQCVRQQDEFLPYKGRPSKRIPVDKTVIEDDFEISDIEVTAEAAEVEYSVTFNNSWTAENHPFDFPSDGRLTPHVFLSHNSDFELWRPGMLASDVVKKLAEEGDETGLYNLIGEAGAALLDGARGTENIGTLRFDSDRRYVTSLSKIDPSPDWFTGITNIEPVRDGRWLKRFTVFVLPFDAGTDGGNNYASSNSPQVPPNVITRITRSSLSRDSPVFVNSGVSNLVHPLGKFDFVLLNAPSPTASTMPSQYLSTAPSIVVSLINSPTSPPVETAPTNSPVGSSLPTEVPTSPANPVAFSLSPTVKVGQPTARPNAPIQSSITPTIPLSGPTNTGEFSQSPTIKVEPTTSAPAPSLAIPTIDSGFSLSPTQKNTPPPTRSPSKAPVPPPPPTPPPTIGIQPPVALPPNASPSKAPPVLAPATPSSPNIESFTLSPTMYPDLNVKPPTLNPTKLQPILIAPSNQETILEPLSNPTAPPTNAESFVQTSDQPVGMIPVPLTTPTIPMNTPFPPDVPSIPPSKEPLSVSNFDLWDYWTPATKTPSVGPSSGKPPTSTNFNFWDFWKPTSSVPTTAPSLTSDLEKTSAPNVPPPTPTVLKSQETSSKQTLPTVPPYVSYLSQDDDITFVKNTVDRDPAFYGIDVTLDPDKNNYGTDYDDLFVDFETLYPPDHGSISPLGQATNKNNDVVGDNEPPAVKCVEPKDDDVCAEVYIPKRCLGCRYDNICKALLAGYGYEDCADVEEDKIDDIVRDHSIQSNPPSISQNTYDARIPTTNGHSSNSPSNTHLEDTSPLPSFYPSYLPTDRLDSEMVPTTTTQNMLPSSSTDTKATPKPSFKAIKTPTLSPTPNTQRKKPLYNSQDAPNYDALDFPTQEDVVDVGMNDDEAHDMTAGQTQLEQSLTISVFGIIMSSWIMIS